MKLLSVQNSCLDRAYKNMACRRFKKSLLKFRALNRTKDKIDLGKINLSIYCYRKDTIMRKITLMELSMKKFFVALVVLFGFSLPIKSEFGEESREKCRQAVQKIRFLAKLFEHECDYALSPEDRDEYNRICRDFQRLDSANVCKELGEDWKNSFNSESGNISKAIKNLFTLFSKCRSKKRDFLNKHFCVE